MTDAVVALSQVRGIVTAAVGAALREQARRTPLKRTGVVVGWIPRSETVNVLLDADALALDVEAAEIIDDEAIEIPAENITGLPMPEGQRVYVEFFPPRRALVVGLALPNLGPPRASLTHSIDQTFVTNVATPFALNTVIYDPFGMVVGSTIVIPYDGLWRLDGSAVYATNAVGRRNLLISRGVTNVVSDQRAASPGNTTNITISRDVPLLAGDVIGMTGTQQSGADLATTVTNNSPILSVRYVGPTAITRV